jgi:hypothetical protein
MTNNKEREEHWVLDKNGEISGLYVVDTTLMQDSCSWDAIDQAIREYSAIHPNEMRLQVIDNAKRVMENTTKTGSNKSKTMRLGVSIPVALMFKLQQIMPDIFEDKRKMQKFMKKYKGLRTCEHV